jgi:hypothetical protein
VTDGLPNESLVVLSFCFSPFSQQLGDNMVRVLVKRGENNRFFVQYRALPQLVYEFLAQGKRRQIAAKGCVRLAGVVEAGEQIERGGVVFDDVVADASPKTERRSKSCNASAKKSAATKPNTFLVRS